MLKFSFSTICLFPQAIVIFLSSIILKNNEVKDFYASLQVLENKRRTIVRNIKKIEDLENENAAYQYYLDAIKRDGVPYELITKALPAIEGEVNNILAQLVDFQMVFEMDGKNINNYKSYLTKDFKNLSYNY